ncbi:M23 family metallopeptidase [Mucilaginibacter sp. dw_454]|uniref:M23 family metallopeptidase n=1 Tax=Mucilaginibacter sp. dw_454 TaxID=2720079 RepID=UPI001BD1E5F0|nr:M23 family metallopeptidase [Mucilaginibacter sp. dw_454]
MNYYQQDMPLERYLKADQGQIHTIHGPGRLQFILAVRLSLLFVFITRAFVATAQVNQEPLDARIIHRPGAFEGSDHRRHLAYEVHLTNLNNSGPLMVKSISIFQDLFGAPMATFSKDELMTLLNAEEMPTRGTDLVLQPGKSVVAFLWLTLLPGAPVPQNLHHSIDFIDQDSKIHTFTGAVTQLDKQPTLSFGAPLRGNIWFVDEGPGNPKSHHWGSMLEQNKIVTIPQRFAIDFFGLNNAGHAVETSPDKLNQTPNTQWIGFGADVLAVRDAVVRDMRDGIPDHAPLSPLPEPTDITARGLYGNFIVLEVAPNVFVHYAHLQNGSIRVRIGQHVKKGDVLAHLGDSGNAGGPHLHFHVSDKPTFELSEGIPFVFSTINVLGKTNEGAMLDSTSTFHGQSSTKKNVLPLYNDVVRF